MLRTVIFFLVFSLSFPVFLYPDAPPPAGKSTADGSLGEKLKAESAEKAKMDKAYEKRREQYKKQEKEYPDRLKEYGKKMKEYEKQKKEHARKLKAIKERQEEAAQEGMVHIEVQPPAPIEPLLPRRPRMPTREEYEKQVKEYEKKMKEYEKQQKEYEEKLKKMKERQEEAAQKGMIHIEVQPQAPIKPIPPFGWEEPPATITSMKSSFETPGQIAGTGYASKFPISARDMQQEIPRKEQD